MGCLWPSLLTATECWLPPPFLPTSTSHLEACLLRESGAYGGRHRSPTSDNAVLPSFFMQYSLGSPCVSLRVEKQGKGKRQHFPMWRASQGELKKECEARRAGELPGYIKGSVVKLE